MTRTKPAAEYPFRATLQRLRLKKKMTQQQLAEKLGVSPVTVSGWELGRRVPEPHTLSRIAQLFGTSVDNLLGYSKTAETFQAGDIAYVPMYGSVAMLEGRLAFLDFHGTYPVPAEAAKVSRGEQAVLITVPDSSMATAGIGVFSQAKFRKKSCKNPKFTFRKSEKNRGSFLPHEGMFHAVAFPFKQ